MNSDYSGSDSLAYRIGEFQLSAISINEFPGPRAGLSKSKAPENEEQLCPSKESTRLRLFLAPFFDSKTTVKSKSQIPEEPRYEWQAKDDSSEAAVLLR